MNSPVLIIGPGKLGSSLFRALLQKKIFPAILVGRKNPEQIHPFEKKYTAFYRTAITSDDVKKCGFIFLAVPDDRIEQVAEELSQFNLYGKTVVHTSGALSSDALKNLKDKQAVTGSFHPMQSFNKRYLDADVWKNIVCSYEGDDHGKPFINALCKKLGAKLIVVNKKQKLALHLAAVVVANYHVGLLSWAEKILQREGIDGDQLKEIIGPLGQQVQNNYRQNELKDILSGPVLRGDLQTLKKHLKYLKDKNSSFEIQLYKQLARLLMEQDIFDLQRKREILKFLDEE